jgi:hypothetical protein
MEHITALEHDLHSSIDKYNLLLKRFVEFHAFLKEGDNQSDIFTSLAVSDLEDNEFSINFIDRVYRVTFSIAFGKQFDGTASCYLANTFPDSGFSLVHAFGFNPQGQTDILDSNNVLSYIMNVRGCAFHILFHWLRVSFIDNNDDEVPLPIA